MKDIIIEHYAKNPRRKDSVILHPEHGLNPSIGQYFCPITGKTWDSGDVLLLGWNKGEKAEMYSVIGTQISPQVQEKIDEGYVAFAEVSNDSTPEKIVRTGRVAYIKREACGAPDDMSVAFIQEEAMEKLLEEKCEDDFEIIKGY